MDKFPKTGASALVVQDKKVLLIQRKNKPYQGAWSLPGGSQYFGETLEACALRELREETGLVAASAKFVDIKEIIIKDEHNYPEYHYLLGVYLIWQYEGTPNAMDDAHALGWYAHDEFASLQTTPDLYPHICEILKKECITF